MQRTDSHRRAIVLSAVVAAVLGVFLYQVQEILTPFLVGLVLAYLINPLITRMEELGVPRTAAATFTIFGAVSLLALGLVLGLPLLIDQLTSFARRLPVYLMTLEHFVLPERLGRMLDIELNLNALLRQLGLLSSKGAQLTVAALQQTVNGAMWLFNIVLLVIMTPLVAFYLVMDWPTLMKQTLQQLPKRWRTSVKEVSSEIDTKMAAYLRGTLGVCLSMGAFYAISLTLIGPLASWMTGQEVESLELGWAVGLVTGLLTFLPIVGASTGVFLMFGMALIQYQLQMWEPYALLLGIFVLGQALEGYVLTPLLVGNRVGLHPLWVIFALLAGGALGGILGMLLALPVAVVISVLLPRLLRAWRESVD